MSSVDSGAELETGQVDPLPYEISEKVRPTGAVPAESALSRSRGPWFKPLPGSPW